MNRAELARMIDHTILKAEATEAEVRKVVQEAIEHRFASVCVNGRWVNLVSDMLHEAGVGDPEKSDRAVLTCAVVGFPLGANRSTVKAIEASSCVKDGAQEVDMVISIPDVYAGNLDYCRQDVYEVVRAARAVWKRTVVKVILETAAMNEEQTALGCQAAAEGGADFVKTSTGFHPKGGATVQAVQWLKKYGGSAAGIGGGVGGAAGGMKVKASGGIRDLAAAQQMIAAGADRLGCSASVAIVSGLAGAGGGY
ncbi:MAG TPA: deoxyribose-phosphate aldolase [Phycisphaerae bacterium]|nr:deoxyribose-phosphate aldolase [Phycisphaerae bacterium]